MAEQSYQEYRKSLLDRNKGYAKKDWSPTMFKSDKEEEQFLQWVAQQASKEDPRRPGMFSNYKPDDAFPDYDMRGFYKDLKAGKQTAVSGVSPLDGRVHGSDYYKTPYHESFSSESQWATKGAPSWQGNKLVSPTGQLVYEDKPQR